MIVLYPDLQKQIDQKPSRNRKKNNKCQIESKPVCAKHNFDRA